MVSILIRGRYRRNAAKQTSQKCENFVNFLNRDEQRKVSPYVDHPIINQGINNNKTFGDRNSTQIRLQITN